MCVVTSCVVCCDRITSVQLNDSDKYVCVAHNSLSRILVGAELTVQGAIHVISHAQTNSHCVSYVRSK